MEDELSTREPYIKRIPIDQLFVDSYETGGYQRDYDQKHVDDIVAEWLDRKFDIPKVSFRANKYWIINGQHSIEAARAKGKKYVYCDLFFGLTREQEAEMFYNQRKNIVPIKAADAMNARLVAGEENATKIKMLLAEIGQNWDPLAHGADGITVACAKAIDSALKKDEWALTEAIAIMHAAWPNENGVFTADRIKAFFTFSQMYRGKYDRKRVIDKVGKQSAKNFTDEAIANRTAKTKWEKIVKQIIVEYNRRKPNGNLTDYDLKKAELSGNKKKGATK